MIRLILVVMFILAFLAIRYLPWWITLSIGIALILSAKFLGWRLIAWLFTLPFRAKAKVLRDASVEVHSIRPTIRPVFEDDDDDEGMDGDENEEPEPRDYYEVEVTITPTTQSGPFQFWEYTEITLVRPRKRWDEDDDDCDVVSVELADNTVIVQKRAKVEPEADDLDEPVEDDDDIGTKVAGPHRIKMVIGTKKGVQELEFRYYMESFGILKLPSR